ncbi:MAG: hypothetical protein AAF533_06910 [Acidobacteriota bacterium]
MPLLPARLRHGFDAPATATSGHASLTRPERRRDFEIAFAKGARELLHELHDDDTIASWRSFEVEAAREDGRFTRQEVVDLINQRLDGGTRIDPSYHLNVDVDHFRGSRHSYLGDELWCEHAHELLVEGERFYIPYDAAPDEASEIVLVFFAWRVNVGES